MKKYVILKLLFCCNIILAQSKVIVLDEVIVSDFYAQKSRNAIVKKSIKDTINPTQNTTITKNLQNLSAAYLKENGRGMVASIALRGTTAAQTALVWNGININSQLTGQTDLNTINPQIFENVSLQLGGGSTVYNSGAIAGSIHLDNQLIFKNINQNYLQFAIGSFNTFQTLFSTQISNEKMAFSFHFSNQQSENNYPIIGTNFENSNGSFYNNSGNLAFAFPLNSKNTIKLFSNFFIGNRRLSPSLAAVSNAKYLDKNFRNLLQWTFSNTNFISDFKYAFLKEEYQYFQDKNYQNYTFGNVNQQIFKLDLKYHFTPKFNITQLSSFQIVNAEGTDIQNPKRTIFDLGLLLNYTIKKHSGVEFQIKQEKSNDFKSPILYSIGNYLKINDIYSVKTQISSNYRMPTFNDMYWNGSGSLNLKPEISQQININNQFKFNHLQLNINAYSIDISQMIQWLPNSNGLWKPINNEQVISRGVELDLEYHLNIKKHQFQYNFEYSFTESSPKNSQLQLIYVPFHKATSTFNYQYQKFSCSIFGSYNGKVFTSSDNFFSLKSYTLISTQFNFEYKKIKLGINIENLTNQFYQNVLNRPLPGRNYNFQIKYNL